MLGNCCPDPEECDCSCHHNDAIRHCAPCCQSCPICGKKIRMGGLKDHLSERHSRASEALEQFE